MMFWKENTRFVKKNVYATGVRHTFETCSFFHSIRFIDIEMNLNNKQISEISELKPPDNNILSC